MEKLLKGIVNFKQEDFDIHRELFTDLMKKQKPHTLFITCSDSRIDPNLITKALPGDLFIVRNIANIVPPYRDTNDYVSTTSAIEYAVLNLNVENIIVCGHSNCGGCAHCLNPTEELDKLVHTKKWLELSNNVRDRVISETSEEDVAKREWMMEQGNVVEQLKHLMTFPFIYERVKSGQLQISGWYYIIESGEIFIYDKDTGEFVIGNG